jgi:hypothetical protein
MKFFNMVCSAAVSICFISSAMAQTLPEVDEDEIVVQGDAATSAEVFPVSPGVATIEIGPLYGVFLNLKPDDVQAHLVQNDKSGKGTAYVAKLRKTSLRDSLVCLKEVGANWHKAPACAKVDGTRVSITLNLGTRRGELFALVPVALDPGTQEQLAWIAHPENTQTQLRCEQGANMASVFWIDDAGTIAIATETQMRAYEKIYCGK